MNSSAKVYIIVALTFILLLLVYYLPPIEIGGYSLRQVDVLSDIAPAAAQEPKGTSAVVEAPAPPQAKLRRKPWKEQWPEGVVPIADYGNDCTQGMSHFYSMLLDSALDRPVRIAYYSDSFVEGDIMLADLRHLLQAEFGGQGVGWVDMMPGFNDHRLTVQEKASGWTRHAVVDKRDFKAALMGPSQAYYTLAAGTAATSVYNVGSKQYSSQWERTTVYLKSPRGAQVSVAGAGTHRLKGSPRVQEATFATGRAGRADVQVSATGGNVTAYGMALEGKRGVVLDNLGMRGIPGFSVADIPDDNLADFARLRPCDLVVLQFGLNALATCKSDKFCKRYMAYFKRAIAKFRRHYPGVSILIVGVSDVQQRSAGGLRTMPQVAKLTAYQQQLAASEKAAFISMQALMGGEGSIGRYVARGWAEKDYHHINPRGGAAVARNFYKSIMGGLDNYRRKKAAGY